MEQQPWETGWQPVDGPAAMSERVATKVVQDATYHLWKNRQGEETIQKNARYYRVAPGAFNTIPTEEHGPGVGHGVTADKI
ncbi:MAG TPA: hypothetical protein VD969_09515 [Symbiobacteriaceae bacterium]|nr:hypothetical protein [Symbiobacteriaceae bacterium]